VVLYGPDGVVIDVVACAGDDAKALRALAVACGLREDGSDPAEECERLRAHNASLDDAARGALDELATMHAERDAAVAEARRRREERRHDVERLTRERDESIALERERCAALVREIPACQPGAKATAARRWLDGRVAACGRAIEVDDETATCARASVRDARERAKAAESDAAKAHAELAAARSTVEQLLGVIGSHGGEVARLQFDRESEAARHAETIDVVREYFAAVSSAEPITPEFAARWAAAREAVRKIVEGDR
jgi:chromosome segregation ATPase